MNKMNETVLLRKSSVFRQKAIKKMEVKRIKSLNA